MTAGASLADVLITAHRDDEAIAVLKKTLELEPDLPHVHRLLALAYMCRGLSDLAMAESRRVVELGDPAGNFLVAQCHAAAGCTAEALATLNTLIPRALDPPV